MVQWGICGDECGGVGVPYEREGCGVAKFLQRCAVGVVVPERGPLKVAAHEYLVVWGVILEEFGDPVEYGLVFEFALRCGWLW